MEFKIQNKMSSIEQRINLWKMYSRPGYAINFRVRFQTKERLWEIVRSGQLPKIVSMIESVNSKAKLPEMKARFEEALTVLPKLAGLMEEGFHPLVVEAMLKESTSEQTGWPAEFGMRFERLRNNPELRAKVWGTADCVTLNIARAIVADLANGINVDNPTEEEFEKSTCKHIAQFIL